MNNLLDILAKEAEQSLSGMTLECAHWPGYPKAFRWISKNRLGQWCDTPKQALEAYFTKNLYEGA